MKVRLVLAAAIALVLAARQGTFDGLGPALLLVGGVLVVLRAFRPRAEVGRYAAGRAVTVQGHAHGSGARQEVAIHEAGHAAAAVALGGRVRSATVSPDGRSGLVRATLPTQDAQAAITFWAAGQIAAGTTRGAGADNDLIRLELRQVPARDRSRVRRDAERHARRIVDRNRARIRRDAARLDERGRL